MKNPRYTLQTPYKIRLVLNAVRRESNIDFLINNPEIAIGGNEVNIWSQAAVKSGTSSSLHKLFAI